MKVRISEDFRAAYKKLKKRHKSLEQDFEHLLASLLQDPIIFTRYRHSIAGSAFSALSAFLFTFSAESRGNYPFVSYYL